jgi:hypothetical protein
MGPLRHYVGEESLENENEEAVGLPCKIMKFFIFTKI